MKRRLLILCLTASSGFACSVESPSGKICTAQFVYGLNVSVRDSATGADLSSGSTVVVRDGNFVDSLTTPYPGSPYGIFSSAGERAGTYSVTVRRAGYRTWTRTGVAVTADECHVRPMSVIALLQP